MKHWLSHFGLKPLRTSWDLPHPRSWAQSLPGLIPGQPQGYNLLLPAERTSLSSIAAAQNTSAAQVRRGCEWAVGQRGGPQEQSPGPHPAALLGWMCVRGSRQDIFC